MSGCRLSVVLPAYQEEALLDAAARRLHVTLVELLGDGFELVIVDDGSRDRTPEIADALAAELPHTQALHQANTGIGGAFQLGVAQATGEYVLLWPADMICTPEELSPYLDRAGQATVIVGCRRGRPGYGVLQRAGAWAYPLLVRRLFGLTLHDVNWICLYEREALSRVRLTRRGIPMLTEILVRIRDAGGTFVEVPVEMQSRQAGVATASRPSVQLRTLVDLMGLWLAWRRGD